MRTRKLLSVLCRRQTCLSETAADMPGISAHKVIKRFLGIALVCLCFAAPALGEGLTVSSDGFPTSPQSQALSFGPTVPATATTVAVTCDAAWTATKSSGDSWITLGASDPASGASNGTFTVTVAANTTGSQRSGTITVASESETSQVITVTQAAASIAVTPTTLTDVSATGLSEATTITVTANIPWEASNGGDSWIVLGTPSGTGTGEGEEFTVTIGANGGLEALNGTITIAGTGVFEDVTQEISVSQAPTKQINLSASTLSPGPIGVTDSSITVTANVAWTTAVAYTDGSGWITSVTSSGTGTGSPEALTITVAPNTGEARVGTITVSGTGAASKDITVTQAAFVPTTFTVDGITYTTTSGTTVAVIAKATGKYSGTVSIPTTATDPAVGGLTYSVTSIGNNAFQFCYELTGITLANTITQIGNSAFSSCNKLTSISIPESVTTIGTSVFSGCYLTSVEVGWAEPITAPDLGLYPEDYSNATLIVPAGKVATYKAAEVWKKFGTIKAAGAEDLSIEILDGTLPFDASAPEVLKVKVTPAGGTWVITKNESATWITIDDEPGAGDEWTFTLTAQANTGLTPRGTLISISNDVISTSIPVPQNAASFTVDGITYAASTEGYIEVISVDNTLETVTIPAKVNPDPDGDAEYNVIGIGFRAFRNLTNIKSVEISAGVLFIKNEAFEGCSNLESITIPAGVMSIGERAFAGCSSLASAITIPTTVGSIGMYAFAGCNNIASFEVGWGTPPTGSYNFGNPDDYSNWTLIVPTGKVADYKAAYPWSQFGTITTEDGADDLTLSPEGICLFDTDASATLTVTVMSDPTDVPEISGGIGYSWLTVGALEDGDEAGEWTFTIAVQPNKGAARSALITVSNTSASKSIRVQQNAFSFVKDGITYTALLDDAATVTGLETGFTGTAIVIPGTVTVGEAPNAVTYTVTAIAKEAFKDEATITSVSIPASVTNIGDDAFAGTGLTSVEVQWTPVELSALAVSADAFGDLTLEDITLIVPFGTVGDYNADDFWGDFDIEEAKHLAVTPLEPSLFEPTGDEDVEITVTANVAWTVTPNVAWITIPADVETNGTGTGTGEAETFTFTVLPYTDETGDDPREGTITVTGTGVEPQEITITQTAPSISAEVDGITPEEDGSLELSAEPIGLEEVTVTVTANIEWTVEVVDAEENAWIDPSEPDGGEFTITVGANTEATSREATITIKGAAPFTGVTKTITVKQAAPKIELVNAEDAELSFGAFEQVETTVNITANIEWAATVSATWIEIPTEEVDGDGSFTVEVISDNTAKTARKKTITISGTGDFTGVTKTITVTQAAPITFTKDVLSYIETGEGTVGVTGLASDATAIVIPAEVEYDGEAYDVTSIEAGAFENSDITSVSIPASIETVGANAFAGSSLTSVEVAWETPPAASEIGIDEAFDDVDLDEVDLIVPYGTDEAYGAADFWAGFKTHTEAKTLLVAAEDFEENTQELSYGPTGVTEVEITVTSNVEWTATVSEGDADWIILSGDTEREEGNDEVLTLEVAVAPNPTEGEARTGTITVSDGELTQVITVTQAAPYITAADTEVGAAETTGTIDVTSNIAWSATVTEAADSWLTLATDPTTGTGDGTLTISFSNIPEDVTQRTATITISGTAEGLTTVEKVITVTQKAPYLTVAENDIEVLASAGTIDVAVDANITWSAAVDPSDDWIDLTEGNGTFTIEFTDYEDDGEDGDPRTAIITITGGGLEETITVTQSAPSIDLSLPSGNIAASGGNKTITVTANIAWTAEVTTEVDWLEITEGEGEGNGNGTFTVTATANSSTSTQSATITVSATGAEIAPQTITVTQAGKAVTPDPGPTDPEPETPAVVAPREVSLSLSSLTLEAGKKKELVATVSPATADNKSVTWTSSDAKVATVADGVVTAVAAGTATITVTTVVGGHTATCTVTVTDATTGIANASADITVRSEAGRLYVNSPAAETVYIYSFNGKLLYTATKASGLAIFNAPSEKLLIVRGTSGWARKLMK